MIAKKANNPKVGETKPIKQTKQKYRAYQLEKLKQSIKFVTAFILLVNLHPLNYTLYPACKH